ncbi:hypothetical protein [Phreatobacter sp.]|uniref:hypothetical protein n=1 Tax=Phreatobacter sp. TaxID=1966341 RepID=UPI0022BF3B00|nr:hypothetical protein [Phreatobacter sp.]MCZ8316313.1 hypothetical protein [Phreatobacter sp.]
MAAVSAWRGARARVDYAVATLLGRPRACVLDRLFAAYPDFYHMRDYGDERMDAIAEVIRREVGDCASLGDVSVYEGYALGRVADRLGVANLSGCDLSEVALDRARGALSGSFAAFDLTRLYDDPAIGLPIPRPDVLLVCECLYYVGPLANHAWSQSWIFRSRKLGFIAALRRHARKAVIFQHFGSRQKDAIGELVVAAGGRKVEDRWGIWLLPATA